MSHIAILRPLRALPLVCKTSIPLLLRRRNRVHHVSRLSSVSAAVILGLVACSEGRTVVLVSSPPGLVGDRLVLVVVGIGVPRDDPDSVDEAGEEAEAAERDVDEGVGRADATFNPYLCGVLVGELGELGEVTYWEGWEEEGEDDEEAVDAAHFVIAVRTAGWTASVEWCCRRAGSHLTNGSQWWLQL